MEYMQLSMDDYIQSKNEIKQELGGIVKSFVRIGWQLTRIDKSGAYKHDGYNTIAEFARTEYGMNPSGVSRFMKVYEKYSVPGDTPELKEQYREFKFNNLVEMLQLPEEDQQIFHPEDKREDIRELKDFNKENESNPMNLLDWKSAQSTEDKLHATIQEFFREKTGILNALYSSEAYQSGNIKEMAQIVNPGDSMSYRKGTVFLMFHQEDITVKIFNEEMRNISWDQFFTYTQEIFAEAAAGAETYENYFGIPEETHRPKRFRNLRQNSYRIRYPNTMFALNRKLRWRNSQNRWRMWKKLWITMKKVKKQQFQKKRTLHQENLKQIPILKHQNLSRKT